MLFAGLIGIVDAGTRTDLRVRASWNTTEMSKIARGRGPLVPQGGSASTVRTSADGNTCRLARSLIVDCAAHAREAIAKIFNVQDLDDKPDPSRPLRPRSLPRKESFDVSRRRIVSWVTLRLTSKQVAHRVS